MKATKPAKPRIVFELDGHRREHVLEGDEAVIGRDADCEIVIDRRWISRKHARLTRGAGGWRVTDLGSLNGTRVNDSAEIDRPLVDGDKILLHRMPLTFIDPTAPRVSLDADSTVSTRVHTAVDFSALAEQSDVGHLRTLLSVVARASQAMLTTEDLDEAFGRVLELVFEHLPVQRGLIMLWDPERGELQPRCVRRAPGEDGQIRFSRTIADQVVRDRVAVLTTDAQVDDRFAGGQSVVELGIRAAMAAPLWRGDAVEGLIYADALGERAFDRFDLELLSAVGNQLALAVERSRLAASVLEQRVVRRRLERYHSPAVIERIAGSAGAAEALLADEREVTVLFADVVGFTRRCEGLEPRRVADLLNRYFGEMAEMVFRHEGTLDKFIGDALMAVFGAPLAAPDHARRALEAALDMREALRRLNEPLPAEQRLRFRVGLHSGAVIAGDIGSPRRRDYTVLGAPVNLAARLESTIAEPDDVVVSQAVLDGAGEGYRVEDLGLHTLRGVASPVRCFRLLGRA